MSNFEPIVSMKYGIAKNEDILAEALNSDDFILQLKRDGVSYNLAKDENGEPHLWGDSISKKTGEVIDKIENFQYIKKWILEAFPNETMISAELYTNYDYGAGEYTDRELSKYMNSLCLCGAEKCNLRIASTIEPKVYLFDLLWFDGEDYRDKPFRERDAKLETFYSQQKDIFNFKWLEKAESILENKSTVINTWLKAGHEGGVLKNLDMPYAWSRMGSTARRPIGYSYKIKQMNTVDVVIDEIYWPEKEFKGADAENAYCHDDEGNPVNRLWALGYINSLGIAVYKDGELIHIGSVASGLNDEIRSTISSSPKDYIGKTIECACMSIDKASHSLRHPRFLCFRPDKEPKNCKWEDIF